MTIGDTLLAGARSRPPQHKAGGWRRRGRVDDDTLRRYLVLAAGLDDTVGIDLLSGAITRLRAPAPGEGSADLPPFTVVEARTAADPERDDLAQPEAITIVGHPEVVGRMSGRRARARLRRLVAPPEKHLLGFAGAAAPYWEFRGMRPSVAVVAPLRGPLLFRRRPDERAWVRFGWPGSDNWLPVEDGRAIGALSSARRDRLVGKDLASALGFRPQYLLVALSRPRDGHCYKTVAAMLPRP